MIKWKVYGPFSFSEPTVIGIVYLGMLEHFLKPMLITDGISETLVFQQDRTSCHHAQILLDYLRIRFPNGWIGSIGPELGAAHSPDLTHLDFFAWTLCALVE